MGPGSVSLGECSEMKLFSRERCTAHFLSFTSNPLMPAVPKALKVVKVLVGMASAAGETNPTPWLGAVTLALPEFT